jgi:hypothetical protein
MYSVPDGWLSQRGLPHSEISGSQPVSGSPELFAAVHVLLRLSLPRHPPCALRSLTVYPKGTCLHLPAQLALPGSTRRFTRARRSFHEHFAVVSRPLGRNVYKHCDSQSQLAFVSSVVRDRSEAGASENGSGTIGWGWGPTRNGSG